MNERSSADQRRTDWVAIAALILGVALIAASVGAGIAEGIAADAEHRGGHVGWLVILAFLTGMTITVVSLIRVLARFAERSDRNSAQTSSPLNS